jgi:lambda family phage holin
VRLQAVDTSSKLAHQRGRSVLLGYMIKKVKDYEMPWRDPELLPILFAAFAAAVTAMLRNLYYGGRSAKVYVFESLLIGSITVGIGFGLKGLGASGDYVFFIGSCIALFGIDFVRHVGMDYTKKKVDK